MNEDVLSTTPLFADTDSRGSFPAPIAVALDIMVSEIEISGEATTADETAAAIEATFLWLGRLWVAEYLHALEHHPGLADEAINRELMERALSGRATTTGRWVGLSRLIRGHLVDHATVVEGLAAIEFAEAAGRLLHFRNHFSHGSFSSTIAEIREHRQLLHDLLALVPALCSQPALCRDVETGVVRAATRDWPEVDAPGGEALPSAHPVIVGAQTGRLDLYPLLHLSLVSGTWSPWTHCPVP